MNAGIEKLYKIAQKDSRLIIGLMSGTSLDGLDIALCKICGNGINTKLSLEQFKTVPYNVVFKENIKQVFSKQIVSLEKLCLLNEWVGSEHASMINDCLKKWKISYEQIDLVASHGQTIYHSPKHSRSEDAFGHGTLQIGDADHISVLTGIITLSDFRQKHIAAGGEGAPLAAYGDFLLFSSKEEDVILLNIGGISNLSFLPSGCSFSEIISTDIGPGNTIMDRWMQVNYEEKQFDESGSIARQGMLNEGLLEALLENTFFALPFPKTTGPELFNLSYLQKAMQKSGTSNLASQDVMATLNYFTARGIADSINKISKKTGKSRIYISGGGLHNPFLMETLGKLLPGISISSTTVKNINPDAKEAILFAILANESVAGNGLDFGIGSRNNPRVSMGKISFPT